MAAVQISRWLLQSSKAFNSRSLQRAPCPTRRFIGLTYNFGDVVSLQSNRKKSTAASTNLITPDNIVQSPFGNKIDIPTNEPFHSIIFDQCDQRKDALAMEDVVTRRSYTYSQIKENTVKVASALYKIGYRKGDVIIAYSTNTMDYTVLMLACSCLGVWFCAANPTLTADEFARQVSHSNSIGVFAAPALVDNVKAALLNKEHPNEVKDLFVFGEAKGFQPFSSLLADDGKAFPDVDITPTKDVFTLPYSSGTTGLPKGVMLTHTNCLANVLQCQISTHMSTSDKVLGLLPFYHIYGMIVVQFGALYAGSEIYVLPKFEPEGFLKCLQDKKISFAHLVPPLLVFLAKNPLVSKYNITSLKHLVCGAAPLGSDVSEALLKQNPHIETLNQAYGLTESSPVTHFDYSSTRGSIGYLVSNTEGKIADIETQAALGPNQEGELWMRGPQVMKGYYKNQKATDEMLDKDGWLHSGDVAVYDETGKFFIRDRMKELIKYKGSQVAPAELEALLLGHPDVQDVAVIGVPDEVAGELPKAFVVRKHGSSVTEEEICKFVADKVSHTKKLRGGAQFVEEIPKNPSGKILRRLIKAKYCS